MRYGIYFVISLQLISFYKYEDCLNNRPHFLSVYRRNNPHEMLGKHDNNVWITRRRRLHDLQTFRVFSRHPKQFITLVNRWKVRSIAFTKKKKTFNYVGYTIPLDDRFLTKRPQSFLIEFQAFNMVWFSNINICVVTKQTRDETTRKVNKWPVTKATFRFSL